MSRIAARIYVPLRRPEWEALRDLADREYRDPREQAGYLLRQALTDLANKNEDTGLTLASYPVSSQTQSGA